MRATKRLLIGLLVLSTLASACTAPGGTGNAERGKQLVATKAQPACGTCHTIPGVGGAAGDIGPSLAAVGGHAAEHGRESARNLSAEQYLKESLTDPNAYVIEGFPSPSPMPSYKSQLTDQELNDIVAFLVTLRQGHSHGETQGS